ncbi:MAG TPA: VOC family protein [Jatrophihabitans sp.]|jgi:4a-hydroxytetrahydrobiopterin dehydratase
MDAEVSPREVDSAEGVDDWRVIGDGLCSFFAAPDLARAASFAAAAAALPGAGAHRPDLDLRAEGVYVRLITHTDELYALTTADLAMARQLSALAAEHGLPPEPARVQTVQLTIDALDLDAVKPFWRTVLGYADRAESPEDLIDPRWRGATIWFQQMDCPRPQRNRIHVDVWVPKEDAAARVAAAVEAGGRIVFEGNAPSGITLADAEGNEVCVASIEGRG